MKNVQTINCRDQKNIGLNDTAISNTFNTTYCKCCFIDTKHKKIVKVQRTFEVCQECLTVTNITTN